MHMQGMTVVLLSVALLLAPTALALSDHPDEQPVVAGPIVINEVLTNPNGSITTLQSGTGAITWTAISAVTDWLELQNRGSSEVDLSGWSVSSGAKKASNTAGSDVYHVPAGIKLPAGAFLVVMCPNSTEPFPVVPAGSNVLVARGFKLGKQGLFVYDGQEKLVAATGKLPQQRGGVTFGLPADPSNTAGAYPYTYLASQTPWLANSKAMPGVGPFIYKLSQTPKGFIQPGQDIGVSAKLRPNQAPVSGAVLRYKVNYGAEKDIRMQADGAAGSNGEITYTATIPATEYKAGNMVRWKVVGQDTAGGVNMEPLGVGALNPQYEGTIVAVPAEANSTVPVFYWYTQDPEGGQSQAGAASSIALNGTLYDNVKAERRGVTALSWKKPKLKFKNKDGFTILPGLPRDNELKLNSYYVELGENSMMKEVVAYQVLNDEGVLAGVSYHVAVYLNGNFYGLFGVIEPVDDKMLERFNLPKSGALFKSLSGELSNLRWDLPLDQYPFYYEGPKKANDWPLLMNFTKGLAGGGPGSRTSYLHDHLNLPAVVNEMAVNTLLGNMDRCTKNFYVYYNPDTEEWSRISWDVEASMGQDNLLNGAPGNLYCILACEQWNSPLYCDSEHPQDIGGIQTPWGQVTAVGMNPYQGSATGRKLLQATDAQGRLVAEGTKPLTFPKPDDWNSPDRNQFTTKSVIGAQGTYNHLTDAVLDVNTTRAMYLRRLRNLADKYYGAGRLRQIIDATRTKIASVAAMDNTVWHNGDGSKGYQQLTTEFIPIRTKQLLQYYAPGGLNPLLPAQQSNSSSMAFKFGPSDLYNSDKMQQYMSIEVQQPGGESVDLSGWSLVKDNQITWIFPQGTVILSEQPIHLSPSVRSFRGRSQSPKAGEAAFVLQVPQELLAASGQSSSYVLQDAAGNNVKLET